jgi:hypothetical protein
MRYILLTFLGLCSFTLLSAQCTVGDCDNGQGTYVYKNGSKYVGDFKNKKAHGYGELFYNDGRTYAGEWASHKFDGKGIYTTKDGKIYQGIWKENKLVMSQDINEIFEKRTTRIVSAPAKKLPPKEKKSEVVSPEKSIAKVAANSDLVKPRTYAVVVGVARYLHMQSLNFTDDDAYKMYAFLKSPEGGAIPDDQIAVLIDESATKQRITDKLKEVFAKANENDMILFYFSGHGEKDGLLPIDFNGYDNVLEHREINEILAQSKAKYKICITDACYSGSMQDVVAFKDNQTEQEAARLKKFYNTSFDAFSTSSTVLMLSSKAEETSVENSGLRQGIFSYFLLEALQGKGDKNNDNVVTLTEAFDYVRKEVNHHTNKYQTPVMIGSIESLIMSELR